jgi:hypothetical protein
MHMQRYVIYALLICKAYWCTIVRGMLKCLPFSSIPVGYQNVFQTSGTPVKGHPVRITFRSEPGLLARCEVLRFMQPHCEDQLTARMDARRQHPWRYQYCKMPQTRASRALNRMLSISNGCAKFLLAVGVHLFPPLFPKRDMAGTTRLLGNSDKISMRGAENGKTIEKQGTCCSIPTARLDDIRRACYTDEMGGMVDLSQSPQRGFS